MDYQTLVSNFKLSQNEDAILNYIQTALKTNSRVKIQDVANACFVSTTSVVKLAKKLGYGGFRELIFDLGNRYRINTDIDLKTFKDLSAIEAEVLITNIAELLHLYKDRQIMIIGTGFGSYASDYMLQKLIIFGYTPIRPLHYETFDNTIKNPGIIIAISESGTSQGKIGTVRKAVASGFNSICFTEEANSPLAQICHFTVPVNAVKSHHTNYTPNFFVSKTLIIFELILTKLSLLD